MAIIYSGALILEWFYAAMTINSVEQREWTWVRLKKEKEINIIYVSLEVL